MIASHADSFGFIWGFGISISKICVITPKQWRSIWRVCGSQSIENLYLNNWTRLSRNSVPVTWNWLFKASALLYNTGKQMFFHLQETPKLFHAEGFLHFSVWFCYKSITYSWIKCIHLNMFLGSWIYFFLLHPAICAELNGNQQLTGAVEKKS